MTEPQAINDIFLAPGDFFFGDELNRVRTTLGSSIAVIAWHPTKKIGGICHYLLPSRHQVFDDIDLVPEGKIDSKYADEAFSLFLMEMMRRRSNPVEYIIKIFGGGDMFPGQIKSKRTNSDIGKKNIEAAHKLMAQHGFKISKEDTGSTGHRNIAFDISSGDIRIRHAKITEEQAASASYSLRNGR